MNDIKPQVSAAGTTLPLWQPTSESVAATNIGRFMKLYGFDSYETLHRWSVEQPADFWKAVIETLGIHFRELPRQVLDLTSGVETPTWLSGARWNISESCFQADSGSPAIVYGRARDQGQVTQTVSYGELQRMVRRVAFSLAGTGIRPGDRVAIVMPMVPESIAIYLGLIHAGCAAVSIADSFASEEIARRLKIAGAVAVFCLDHYTRGGKRIELYRRILDAQPPRTIVLPPEEDSTPLREGDVTWESFLQAEEAPLPCLAETDDPINILFSSGTTGDPKAIPWTHDTPIKCASDAYFHHDIQPGDVVTWPTNLGWMMGPWLIFAALIRRAAIGLFEDPTQGGNFGRFVERAGVTMLGVVPALVRSWRASRCMEERDWSAIRCFSSTGEASQVDEMRYLSQLAGGKPIIEYCGGTEIGGGYITSSPVHANFPSAFSCPALGSEITILDAVGQPADEGELFLVPPAMGLSRTLLNRDHHATYYDGVPSLANGRVLRRHGDHFRRLPNGTFVAGGRVDDTMNLGGIKVSSAELEQVLNQVPEISETAAVAVTPAGGGPEELAVFAILKSPFHESDLGKLRERMNQELRARLNPLFRVSHVRIVAQLPRTASNKVMRRELRTLLTAGRS